MSDPRYVFQQVTYEAITPIHVGSGQDVGIVDLPVVRERTTDHPFLPGSGIRGAIRSRCERESGDLVLRLFGTEGEGEPAAGCAVVLDAHLVLFPVRSSPGVFRWITSPFVLRRWKALRQYFLEGSDSVAVPSEEPDDGIYSAASGESLFLEEYPFKRSESIDWTWTEGLLGVAANQVVLLSDADFLHFVRHATLVRQRNRLTTAKTVLKGHLFSVEAVPAETRFVGFVGATGERTEPAEGERLSPVEASGKIQELLVGSPTGSVAHLTLGGDESVGMGVTRMCWDGEAEASEGGMT